MRALRVSRRIRSATRALRSSAESGLSPASSRTVATSDTGSAGTTSPTSASVRAEPFDLGEARVSVEHAEIDAALGDVLAQRHRLAETDAGIAVAIQLAAERQPDVIEYIAGEQLRR